MASSKVSGRVGGWLVNFKEQVTKTEWRVLADTKGVLSGGGLCEVIVDSEAE